MRFVYVLDQDPEVRKSVTRLLGNYSDMLVRTFATGTSFLAAIGSLDPGILLIELEIPDISGMAVLDALRAQGDDRIVPVLVEACKQAPNDSFWQKVRAEARKLAKAQ